MRATGTVGLEPDLLIAYSVFHVAFRGEQSFLRHILQTCKGWRGLWRRFARAQKDERDIQPLRFLEPVIGQPLPVTIGRHHRLVPKRDNVLAASLTDPEDFVWSDLPFLTVP